jgi:hypothetical protein
MNSMPTDFTSLNYPTIVNYNLKFDNGLSVYLNASVSSSLSLTILANNKLQRNLLNVVLLLRDDGLPE